MRIAFILAAMLAVAPAAAQDHGGHSGHGGHGGHGDHGDHDGHDMSHMNDTARFGAPGDPAKATRTVTIRASEIAFDLGKLEVKTGETVRFVLVNDGTQDHELGVGDAAFFEAHRKMVAEMPGMAHDMPNAVTAKPGESASFAWTFNKPGAFQFACSMPGHSELGMTGAITVN